MALTDAENLAAPRAGLMSRVRALLTGEHAAAQRMAGMAFVIRVASAGVIFLVANRAGALDGQLRFWHLCLGLDVAGAGRRYRASRAAADRAALHSRIHPSQPARHLARLPDRQPLDHVRPRDGVRPARRGCHLCADALARPALDPTVLSRLHLAAVLRRFADVRRAGAVLQLDRAGARPAFLAAPCRAVRADGPRSCGGIRHRRHDHHDRTDARDLEHVAVAARVGRSAVEGRRAVRRAAITNCGAGSQPRYRSSWFGRSTPCSATRTCWCSSSFGHRRRSAITMPRQKR